MQSPPDLSVKLTVCGGTCTSSQYCFGSDVGSRAFVGDGGATDGCHPLPGGCNACACLLQSFNPMYCGCSLQTGTLSVQCVLL
jgi:hypothetical protein